MSSTRHASPDADLRQERWCSAPEFNQALNAIAVAKRAQLVREPELRALLWFLQWRSLEPDGIRRVADDLLAFYPERIGTPTMREIGCEPERIYSAAEVGRIRWELPARGESFRLRNEEGSCFEEMLHTRPPSWRGDLPNSYPADDFLKMIGREKSDLTDHLRRVCLDPGISLTDSAKTYSSGGAGGGLPTTLDLWWFHDLAGALLEYRQNCAQQAAAKLADTEISTLISATLDFSMRAGRMVLIEGNPGLGKSATTKTWCEMQGGLARWVAVPPGNDDRSFFAAIAEALGVASGMGRTGQEIKTRVEEALHVSGLMIVFDEASRLWPQFVRPKGQPSRMLWLMQMYERGTRFALGGFLFSKWRQLYAEKTDWPDEQFERRLNRTVQLPAMHCESDLHKIAAAIFPEGSSAARKLLVALPRLNPKKGASAMIEVVATARDIAAQEGLAEITFEVLSRAIRTNHPEMIPAADAGGDVEHTRKAALSPAARVPGVRRIKAAHGDFQGLARGTGAELILGEGALP